MKEDFGMKQKLSIQIEYKKIDSGISLTKLHGRCAEIRIPEMVEGLPVVAIGERAFAVKMEASVAEPMDEMEAELSFVTEVSGEMAE